MKKVCNYITLVIISILFLMETYYVNSIFDIEFIKEHLFPTKDKIDLLTWLVHCVIYGFIIKFLFKQIALYKKNKDNKEEIAPK